MQIEQNNLSLLNYKFKLKRTPEVEYRVQSVSLPGFNLGTAFVPTPFVKIPVPGELSNDDLTITLLVGENMKDYLEIYNWMIALGHPDNFEQYEAIKSDCNVMILNSAKTSTVNIRFTDIYPTDLSSIIFDSTLGDVQYATVTVTFKFGRCFFENF